LLTDDSPFRNPPASMPAMQRVEVDGLRYAADMLSLSVGRLYSNLHGVSTTVQRGSLPTETYALCIADAWAIVDDLWRFNKLLLHHMPDLKQTPDVKVREALGAARQLRNGFQHLDERVTMCAREQLPLWGTLAWVFFPDGATKAGKLFLMIPGSLRPSSSPFVNPAGQLIASSVDVVTLTAFGHKLNLSFLVRHVAALIEELDQDLRRSTAGQPGGGADVLAVAEFVPQATEGQSVSSGRD